MRGLFLAFCAVFLLGLTPSWAVQNVPPGSDLTRATQQAKNGDVLQLSAGEYPGQIQALKKKLTILGSGAKTVLTGSKAQSIATVRDGGDLTLSGVTFQTRSKDGLAAYVNKGKLTLNNCFISKTVQPALYSDGGEISVEKCAFTHLQADGVVGTNGSKIHIRNSHFDGIGKAGAAIQKGGSLSIKKTEFTNVKGQAVYVSGKAVLNLEESTFSKIAQAGVVVSQESHAEIRRNRFSELLQVGILSLKGSHTIAMANSFDNIKSTAVHSENGGYLTAINNAMVKTGDGIVVLKGDAAAVLKGNKIYDLPPDKAGIVVQANGAAAIDQNVIIGGRTGIMVRGVFDGQGVLNQYSGTLVVQKNYLLNQSNRSIDFEARSKVKNGVSVFANKLINPGGLAALFINSPQTIFSGNVVLTDGKDALFLQDGSNLIFENNVIEAAERAIVFTRSAGLKSRYANDIFLGSMSPATGAIPTPATYRMAAVLRDRALAPEFRKQATAIKAWAKSVKTYDQVKDGAADAFKDFWPLLTSAWDATKEVAMVGLRGEDLVGNTFKTAYTVLNAKGDPVSAEDTMLDHVAVMPGTYFVEPSFDRRQLKKVTLEAGKTVTVSAQSKDHLVLRVATWGTEPGSAQEIRLPLQFKPQSELRKALKAIYEARPPTKRSNVSAKEGAAALALAREREDEVIAASRAAFEKVRIRPNKVDEAKWSKLLKDNTRWQDAVTWWSDILSVFGEEADAKRLAEKALSAGENYWTYLRPLLAIERRLGRLADGETVRLLSDGSPSLKSTVAGRLHSMGVSAGSDALYGLWDTIDFSKNDWGQAAYSWTANQKDRSPALMLDGMRKIIIEEAKRVGGAKPDEAGVLKDFSQNAAILNAALYLLAYGDVEDRKTLSAMPLHINDGAVLIRYLEDPIPVFKIKFGLLPHLKPRADVNWAGSQCPDIERFHSDQAEELHRTIESLAFQALSMQESSKKYSPKENARYIRVAYRTAKGFCDPSLDAAETVFSQGPDWLLDRNPWIERAWDIKGIVNKVFGEQGSLSSYWLDKLDSVEVAKALEATPPHGSVKMPELFLAAHKVAGKRCSASHCAVSILSPDSPPGALVASYQVRPYFLNGTIRIALSSRAAIKKKVSLASMIDNMLHHLDAVRDSKGKSLIQKAFLQQGGSTFELKEIGQTEEGAFLYEAPWDGPLRLDGVTLYLDLAFLSHKRELAFDLSNGEAARDLRRHDEVVASLKGKAETFGDLMAEGHALRGLGQLEKALMQYKAALKVKPKAASVWVSAGKLYEDHEMYGRAQEIYGAGLAAYETGALDNRSEARLTLALAHAAYKNEDYQTSAKAYGALAGLRPKDGRWPWWRAANDFLTGDFAKADAYFSGAETNYQKSRTVLMGYLSAWRAGSSNLPMAMKAMQAEVTGLVERLIKDGKLKKTPEEGRGIIGTLQAAISPEKVALEQAGEGAAKGQNIDAVLQALKGLDGNCMLLTLLGVKHGADEDKAVAKRYLAEAINVCSPRSLERRSARAELSRLN